MGFLGSESHEMRVRKLNICIQGVETYAIKVFGF